MNTGKNFVASIERFMPHTFQAKQGEGLFMSHAHEYDELTLILEGEGYYSSAEQNIKVAAGDLILISSGTHHGFVCTQPWQGISVHFFYSRMPAYSQYLYSQAFLNSTQIRMAHLNEEDRIWAEISLSRMEKEWHMKPGSDLSYDLRRIVFETVLLLFHRNTITAQALEKTTDKEIFQEVLKEIHRSYNMPITIKEIASHHFLSESVLRKKFSQALGISPKQYLINLRLEEAKRLLQQTDKPIDSISSAVGFTSSSRFYELFEKSVGVTPLTWRKQNQNLLPHN
ncbi:AraC family transcriptional regulator [Paenibacillus sp. S150]|uniref:helix-turn-helix domain-containing protein n=1 Tax=Paenibacillus sp. S150 TaxID=2749826 RepID=UPI001E2E818E|nr:AraC family transcriptional regulator [Paenibacillus sp. S150]